MSVLVWAGVVLVGGLGSVVRFLVAGAVDRRTGSAFPFGTLTVNLTGALVLGALTGLALDHDAALVAGTATIGAYTTFSTWMTDTHRLGTQRRWWFAVLNVVGSLVLGVAAAFAGFALTG